MSEFLYCKPSVCVVGNDYEIVLYNKAKGISRIKVGERYFYEKNAGVLKSEQLLHKIRVPQALLDKAETYEVLFREAIDRKAYFSKFKDEESLKFNFNPIEKTEGIKIFHIADVHYAFDTALKMTDTVGCDIDLFILNGDIGEVETEENYIAVLKFMGDLAKGEVPILFSRGNHDTRGKLAERFTEYFPTQNGNTYFSFSVGALSGIVLDCGEDKVDNQVEYNSVNNFYEYRREELEYLKSLNFEEKDKYIFAVSHICPVQTTVHKGDIFDIERDVYASWNSELERIGIKFMICGHLHRAFILSPGDEASTLDHNYPVIVGSAKTGDSMGGALITLYRDETDVEFIYTTGEKTSVTLK